MESTVWKTVNDRIFANPIYFIFGLSWFLVHWRFFVVMFFVSSETILSKYYVTKDVYLKHVLFDPNHWLISSFVLLLPFVITGLVLYLLQPKVLLALIKKHTTYEVEKERIGITAEKELTEARVGKVKAEVVEEKIKATKAVAQAKRIEADPTSTWPEEFEDFKKSLLYPKFDYIIQAVYEHSGDTVVKNESYYGAPPTFQIPKDILAFSHTSDLVSMDKVKGKIELTEKGKYFVKRASS